MKPKSDHAADARTDAADYARSALDVAAARAYAKYVRAADAAAAARAVSYAAYADAQKAKPTMSPEEIEQEVSTLEEAIVSIRSSLDCSEEVRDEDLSLIEGTASALRSAL